MSGRPRRLGVSAAAVLLLGCTPAGDAPPDAAAGPAARGVLEGVWRMVELTRASGESVRDQPGLYFFGAGHYSAMYANTATPRAAFADPTAPTDAEARAAYTTFSANAGTYSLEGDTLSTRPAVAKNPNYVGGGNRYTVRVQGDTLWLRTVPGAFRWAVGPAPSPADTTSDTYRLVRVE